MTKVQDHNMKNNKNIIYPNIPSAIWSVAHDQSLPICTPSQKKKEPLTLTLIRVISMHWLKSVQIRFLLTAFNQHELNS